MDDTIGTNDQDKAIISNYNQAKSTVKKSFLQSMLAPAFLAAATTSAILFLIPQTAHAEMIMPAATLTSTVD